MAEWNVTENAANGTIVVRVVGSVGVDDAAEAAKRVGDRLEVATGTRRICFDISEIESYSVKAREHWSELLKVHRDRVIGLTWVTRRSTHRMVARAVGLFTGIPTQIVEDMPADFKAQA
jgi:hypothetical protein